MSFTLEDIERRFFSMDEQIARDKSLTRIALGSVANSLKRGNHRTNNKGRQGKQRQQQSKHNASANATSASKPIICYNCSKKDHISPNCPHPKPFKPFKQTTSKTGSTIAKSRVATATNSPEDETALVCSARVINFANNSTDIQLEHDMTVRPTTFPNINYQNDSDLTSFLDCSNYSTVWIETYDHFKSAVDADPKIEAFVHDRPMEEDLIDVATIFELNHKDSIPNACRQIIKEGAMPIIQKIFIPQPWTLPTQFHLWLETIRFLVRHKLLELQYTKADTYLTVTNTDSGLQLTFYPIGAAKPTLHLRVATEQYFFTYNSSPSHAQAAMAQIDNLEKKKSKANKVKDPTIQEIGDPRNLNNYLPDSGATQHMTPCLADLVDTGEGQKLGVEVADGHIIKCTTTGNTRISMQDDNGNPFNATLSEVMDIPGLSRHLFSITQFAQHGHRALVQEHGTTLWFGPRNLPVTIPYNKTGKSMASNLAVLKSDINHNDTYHKIPTYLNKDQ